MLRGLAFGLFTWAAFDLPTWRLDRLGLAALAFGVLALTVGRYSPRTRTAKMTLPQRAALLNEQGKVDLALLDEMYPDDYADMGSE